MKFLKTFAVRHAVSVGMVVFIAALTNMYFSFSKEYWICLVAFFICQTTRGTPLRQGIIFFLIISLTMFAVSLIKLIVTNQIIFYSVLGTVFIFGAFYIFVNRFASSNKTIFILLFLFIWMIVGLSPTANTI